ncbi:helix-hairpin-helix domain-containing protein, partial [bacterium]|nr:helix-hairpin-helix domain-containing protein [bacterium]
IEYRKTHKGFKYKNELLNVKGIGKKTFEQAEGFLRVKNDGVLIENTGIIEEYKPIIKALEKMENSTIDEILKKRSVSEDSIQILKEDYSMSALDYIKNAIIYFGNDLRDKKKYEEFLPEIKHSSGLKEGDVINVRIKNITSFGVFCDTGAHFDIFVPGNFLDSELFAGKIINVTIEKIGKKGVSGRII